MHWPVRYLFRLVQEVIMLPPNRLNRYTKDRLYHMPARYGLMAIGPGAAAHTCMYAAIGTGQGQDVFGYVVHGNAAHEATGGTEAIGVKQFAVGSYKFAVLQPAHCKLITANLPHIRSGTSIPNNFIPLLITLPEAAESCSLNCLEASSSACKIDFSW